MKEIVFFQHAHNGSVPVVSTEASDFSKCQNTRVGKKETFFSLFDTQTSGQLSFTPALTRLPSGTPLQPFSRIIQVNNNDLGRAPLTWAVHNNRQMATAPRPPPRFVWLRFILGKVASANR